MKKSELLGLLLLFVFCLVSLGLLGDFFLGGVGFSWRRGFGVRELRKWLKKDKTGIIFRIKQDNWVDPDKSLQKVTMSLKKNVHYNLFLRRAKKVATQDSSLQIGPCMPITYLISPNKIKPGKNVSWSRKLFIPTQHKRVLPLFGF